MTSGPPRGLPLAHRLARALSVGGLRGAHHVWRVAEAIRPLPGAGLVLLPAGAPLAFDPGDWVAINAYRGLYERAELSVLPSLLQPGDVVVDVGANIGYFTASAARWISPGGRVIAVEPSAGCQARLRDVVGMLSVRVDLQPVAAGERDGTAVLTGNGEQAGLGTLREVADHGGEVVVVERLEGVLSRLAVTQVAMIKIDVEGFEREALAGLGSFLTDGRARSLLIEVSPEFGPIDHIADLLAAMEPRFTGFAIGEVGTVRRRTRLTSIAPDAVAAATRQFNLLVVRDDALASIERLAA